VDETREGDGVSSSIRYCQVPDQIKPHMVINALKEYYGASIGVSGERQKFLSLLQNEEKIHHLLGDKDSQPSCPV